MARERASLVAAGRKRGRQAVWDGIRRLRRFTLVALADAVKQDKRTVSHYVASLTRGGYLRCEAPAAGKSKIYDLVQDVGVEAPRLCNDGTPCAKGRCREQMWRTIRMLDAFSARELAFCASTEELKVEEEYASHYAKHLCDAGYLALVSKAAPGRPAVYRPVKARYSGPRAPVVSRLQSVFDPNLGRVVWHEEPDE